MTRTGAGEQRCGEEQGECVLACCLLLLGCRWLLMLGGHAVQLSIVCLSWHEQNHNCPSTSVLSSAAAGCGGEELAAAAAQAAEEPAAGRICG